jgi:outer membrane protein OmpA-like peptidoglycan-associated protein
MQTKRVLAAAALSFMLATPARSAEGFYFSLEGGAGSVADWEHTRTKWTWCGPEVKEASAGFDSGWAIFGAVGYATGGWRIEAEGGYRRNEIESYVKIWKHWNWVHEWRLDASGELSEASLIVNIIYDVPLFERISLAVGLGAGADYASFELATPWAPVDEADWHFAYQAIAGLNYALTEMTVVFVNYRYANARDIAFDPTPYLHLEGEDFEKQAATVGMRFALSAPDAPAPPPPTAPTPVPLEREFIVFFGFNESKLTAQALATIKKAVGAVHASGSATILVVGHADRAGSIAYNKVLSLRRAKSVKKALIDEGIAAAAISISGRGESEPMVPTADGVREAQNRRVHISF